MVNGHPSDPARPGLLNCRSPPARANDAAAHAQRSRRPSARPWSAAPRCWSSDSRFESEVTTMLIRVKRKLRHPDAPQRHDNHRRPDDATGAHRARLSDRRCDSAVDRVVQPVRESARGFRAARDRLAGGREPARLRRRPKPARRFRSSASTSRAARTSRARTCSSASRTVSSTRSRRPATASSACRATRSRASRKPSASATATSNGDHTDTSLGLAFHSDSAFLRGMYASFKTAGIGASINGAVIPARSENDTGNNPHNPLYGIQRAGAEGSILTLIGSQNTDSGGNSMAPAMMINAEFRPTKVDRPSDVTGLVGTSDRPKRLTHEDEVAAMEAIYRHQQAEDGQQRLDGIELPDPSEPDHARPGRRGAREVRLPRRRLHQGKVRQRRAEPGHGSEHRRRRRASSPTRSSTRAARTATSSARRPRS